MNAGFFKLQRRFFTHWLWTEPRELSRAEAFLDLLQLACFVPTTQIIQGKTVPVPRGGLVASERYLATRWKWSRTKVRLFLGQLLDERMLRLEKNHAQTILILCNYARWNDSETTKEPAEDHREATGEPNKKKEKKDEKSHPPSTPAIATPDDVRRYAASAPVLISPECATAFHDGMEATGLADERPPRPRLARRPPLLGPPLERPPRHPHPETPRPTPHRQGRPRIPRARHQPPPRRMSPTAPSAPVDAVLRRFEKMIADAPETATPTIDPPPCPPGTLSTLTGLPIRYRHPWDHPGDPTWHDRFHRSTRRILDGGLLALIGPRGTGKTRLAAEPLRHIAPRSGTYTTAMGLFLRLRAS